MSWTKTLPTKVEEKLPEDHLIGIKKLFEEKPKPDKIIDKLDDFTQETEEVEEEMMEERAVTNVTVEEPNGTDGDNLPDQTVPNIENDSGKILNKPFMDNLVLKLNRLF